VALMRGSGIPPGATFDPRRRYWAGSGEVLLTTRLGPLDVLCRLHDGRGYPELLPATVETTDENRRLRVLGLPELIAIKSKTGRSRDQMVVPSLLALLRRRGD
jgi:hypothetical protein